MSEPLAKRGKLNVNGVHYHPVLVRCPATTDRGSPCPAYLNCANGDAECADHGIVGQFECVDSDQQEIGR